MENALPPKVKTIPANGSYIRNICGGEFLIPSVSSGFSAACEQLTISKTLKPCRIYSMGSFTLLRVLFQATGHAGQSKKYSFGRISMFLDLIHSHVRCGLMAAISCRAYMTMLGGEVGLGYLTRYK